MQSLVREARLEHAIAITGAFHQFQNLLARVLKRDIEIGQDAARRHQRNDLVDMGIGIDIMQPDPGTQASQAFGQIMKPAGIGGIDLRSPLFDFAFGELLMNHLR